MSLAQAVRRFRRCEARRNRDVPKRLLTIAQVALAVLFAASSLIGAAASPRPDKAAPPSSARCETTFRPPYAARQAAEFYRQSAHFKGCAIATKRLLDFRWKTGKYEITAPPKEEARYRGLMERYVAACMFKLEDEVSSRLLDPEYVALIRQAVGYFHILNTKQVLFCNGVVVKNKVLTARHCFADNFGRVRVSDRVRFKRIDEAADGFPVTVSTTYHPAAPTFDRSERGEDWLILEIVGSGFEGPKISVQTARLWEPAVLVSFDPRLLVLRQGSSAKPPAGKAKPSAVEPRENRPQAYIELSPLCRVAAVQGRFMFHACQSEVGTSGGPLITITAGGSIAIMGVQSGRAIAVADSCHEKLTDHFPNYATALPADIVQKLQAE